MHPDVMGGIVQRSCGHCTVVSENELSSFVILTLSSTEELSDDRWKSVDERSRSADGCWTTTDARDDVSPNLLARLPSVGCDGV